MSELTPGAPWPVDEAAYRDDDLFYASVATGGEALPAADGEGD